MKKPFTVCDGCPILNNDYEQGSSCNLSYDTKHIQINNKDWKTVSENCELNGIETVSSWIAPDQLELDESEITESHDNI
jgi:hypothetical protein